MESDPKQQIAEYRTLTNEAGTVCILEKGVNYVKSSSNFPRRYAASVSNCLNCIFFRTTTVSSSRRLLGRTTCAYTY